MAKSVRRTLIIVLTAIVAIAMLIPIQSQYVNAQGGGWVQTVKFKKLITVYRDSIVCYAINMGVRDNNAKKITATSSNKAVAAIDKDALSGKNIYFEEGKCGTATITIKIKKKSKTDTYKCKVKVVNYSSPAKLVKFGKCSLTKKFKSKRDFRYKPKKKQERIHIKCKKGWKVKIVHKWEKTFGSDLKEKVIKNGYKITYRKNSYYEVLSFTFYNKSRNYLITKYVRINY